MRDNIEQRAEELAVYMIENRSTVRSVAHQFGISKSTVHMAVTKQNGTSRPRTFHIKNTRNMCQCLAPFAQPIANAHYKDGMQAEYLPAYRLFILSTNHLECTTQLSA